MQTYLSVSVREQGESVVVELDGELDMGSSPQLEQALEHVWRGEPEMVVIDLRKLSFIDMAGMRVLLTANDRAERESSRLLLANMRDQVRRVMQLANLNGTFDVLEALD